MQNFVQYSQTRKEQIAYLKNRLNTLRPEWVILWNGERRKKRALWLGDYVVYAALRGADYRKGDHTGGRLATEALKGAIASVRALIRLETTDQPMDVARKRELRDKIRSKYVPTEHTSEQLAELLTVLEGELAKWEHA